MAIDIERIAVLFDGVPDNISPVTLTERRARIMLPQSLSIADAGRTVSFRHCLFNRTFQ